MANNLARTAVSAYKTGSFNLIPSFVVMTVAIAGIGALPWGLRRLMSGEFPRSKDDFEKFVPFQRDWDRGAAYASTAAYRADEGRGALEAAWAARWKQVLQ
jgi:hypothetical protein